MSYPTVDFPTILKGRVWGDKLRLESLDKLETYLTPFNYSWFSENIFYANGYFQLLNCGIIRIDGKDFGVTHLQKYSKKGWLKAEPRCDHWWYSFKNQEQDANGNWIPDTEKVLYYRSPSIPFIRDRWRWDVAGTMIDGKLCHWIKTKGFFGGHFD